MQSMCSVVRICVILVHFMLLVVAAGVEAPRALASGCFSMTRLAGFHSQLTPFDQSRSVAGNLKQCCALHAPSTGDKVTPIQV